MTREEKIDQIVHKCRRTSNCRECKLYGYFSACPAAQYLRDGTPMADWSVNRAYEILFENEETRKEFTKADLEDGMVVELRNGKHLLVVKRGKKIKMLTETQYYSGDDVTDDLREKNISEKRGELLWERREEMTLAEVEKELGYKIKIVEECENR